MAKLVDVWIFDWDKSQPRRSRAKMRQFSSRASTPRGSREKQAIYPLAVLALSLYGRDQRIYDAPRA